MSIEVHPAAELTPRQFLAEFQIGRVLVERAARLKLEVDGMYAEFSEDAPVDLGQSSPDTFMPLTGTVPEKAAAEYVRALMAMNGMNAAVKHRQKHLNQALRHRPIAVSRVQPEGDSPIVKMAFWSNPMFGQGWNQKGRRDSIQGTISHINIIDNLLKVKPRKFTYDSSDSVVYHMPVVDKNNSPLLSIEFREPTMRDRREPGFVAKAAHAMFGIPLR